MVELVRTCEDETCRGVHDVRAARLSQAETNDISGQEEEQRSTNPEKSTYHVSDWREWKSKRIKNRLKESA